MSHRGPETNRSLSPQIWLANEGTASGMMVFPDEECGLGVRLHSPATALIGYIATDKHTLLHLASEPLRPTRTRQLLDTIYGYTADWKRARDPVGGLVAVHLIEKVELDRDGEMDGVIYTRNRLLTSISALGDKYQGIFEASSVTIVSPNEMPLEPGVLVATFHTPERDLPEISVSL